MIKGYVLLMIQINRRMPNPDTGLCDTDIAEGCDEQVSCLTNSSFILTCVELPE